MTERCIDFCQDDLADDDVIILGEVKDVFIWFGSKCSKARMKLALKSAQVSLCRTISYLQVRLPYEIE